MAADLVEGYAKWDTNFTELRTYSKSSVINSLLKVNFGQIEVVVFKVDRKPCQDVVWKTKNHRRQQEFGDRMTFIPTGFHFSNFVPNS